MLVGLQQNCHNLSVKAATSTRARSANFDDARATLFAACEVPCCRIRQPSVNFQNEKALSVVLAIASDGPRLTGSAIARRGSPAVERLSLRRLGLGVFLAACDEFLHRVGQGGFVGGWLLRDGVHEG